MTAYMPSAWCAKCNKEPDKVGRRQQGPRRFVVVECHGEKTELGFSSQPGAQVRVFDDKGAL